MPNVTVCISVPTLIYSFLFRDGANFILKALSVIEREPRSGCVFDGASIPFDRILYIMSTITSFSLTASPLKCFRTASASCSLLTFVLPFLRAIVGECRPMPGFVRTAWLRGE